MFTLLSWWVTAACLVTYESWNFVGDTPKKGTIAQLKISKFTDFVKQIAYIGVIDPAESKSGLFLS